MPESGKREEYEQLLIDLRFLLHGGDSGTTVGKKKPELYTLNGMICELCLNNIVTKKIKVENK